MLCCCIITGMDR